VHGPRWLRRVRELTSNDQRAVDREQADRGKRQILRCCAWHQTRRPLQERAFSRAFCAKLRLQLLASAILQVLTRRSRTRRGRRRALNELEDRTERQDAYGWITALRAPPSGSSWPTAARSAQPL